MFPFEFTTAQSIQVNFNERWSRIKYILLFEFIHLLTCIIKTLLKMNMIELIKIKLLSSSFNVLAFELYFWSIQNLEISINFKLIFLFIICYLLSIHFLFSYKSLNSIKMHYWLVISQPNKRLSNTFRRLAKSKNLHMVIWSCEYSILYLND